jgi:hypothetical protein
MVAVCVVANTLFPVTVSIEDDPDDPRLLRVQVRQESGEITFVTLSAERSAALRARYGQDLSGITGLPWRQVLADL